MRHSKIDIAKLLRPGWVSIIDESSDVDERVYVLTNKQYNRLVDEGMPSGYRFVVQEYIAPQPSLKVLK